MEVQINRVTTWNFSRVFDAFICSFWNVTSQIPTNPFLNSPAISWKKNLAAPRESLLQPWDFVRRCLENIWASFFSIILSVEKRCKTSAYCLHYSSAVLLEALLQNSAGGDKRHVWSLALFCWNTFLFKKCSPCVYTSVTFLVNCWNFIFAITCSCWYPSVDIGVFRLDANWCLSVL